MGILDQDVRQFEATTGRRLPAFLKRRFSEAALREKSRRALESRRLGILEKTAGERLAESQRQFDIKVGLTEEQIKAQEEADVISGAVDIGTLAISAKKSGILKGSPYVPSATTTTPTLAGEAGTGLTREALLSGSTESGAVATEIAPAASPGILSTIGTVGKVIGPAVAGFTGGRVGGFLGKKIAGEEPRTGERIAGGAVGGTAGATAGAIIGSPGGPVGAGIGAIIGGIYGAITGSSLDEDTHICTELHRQGLLSDELYKMDVEFSKTLHIDVINGYQVWAKPVADKMKTSKALTKFVSIFAIAWARQMAHRIKPDKYKSSWLGRTVLKIGVPLCRINGRKIKWQVSYPELVNQVH